MDAWNSVSEICVLTATLRRHIDLPRHGRGDERRPPLLSERDRRVDIVYRFINLSPPQVERVCDLSLALESHPRNRSDRDLLCSEMALLTLLWVLERV